MSFGVGRQLAGPIVCLLPSATEIVFAVGAGSRVVGVTHECDYPRGVSSLPHVTRSLLPPGLTSAEIDTAVCRAISSDEHTIYALEKDKLAKLAPEAIVTQALCDVCAVPERNVKSFACSLPAECRVVSADPETLEELFQSIRIVGEAVCAPGTAACIAGLRARLERISLATQKFTRRQRVAVLEWPEPPYAPGHWVPDMIEAAGGICCLGESGQKSTRITWETLAASKPDIIVCAFCGFNLRENEERLLEVKDVPEWVEISSKVRLVASNANAYYSRPGPRLIDGVELLARLLHKETGALDGVVQAEEGQMSEFIDGKWVDLSTMSRK